jgi:hypothetical protein
MAPRGHDGGRRPQETMCRGPGKRIVLGWATGDRGRGGGEGRRGGVCEKTLEAEGVVGGRMQNDRGSIHGLWMEIWRSRS